jgi:3-hydroxybutyrate dehydrogenase
MTVRYGLQGKNVLITGAAGGIGRALAAAFAEQGATLVLVDRHADALHAFARDLPAIAAVHAWSCDLTNDADVGTLAHQVWQQLGRVDVLINNAGVEYPTPISAEGQNLIARWASLLDNNVVSMVRLTRALLPLMQTGASIINQSSIWGHTGVADFSAYSASKHAVLGLTRHSCQRRVPGLDTHRCRHALAAGDGPAKRSRHRRDGTRDRGAPGRTAHAGGRRHRRRVPVSRLR